MCQPILKFQSIARGVLALCLLVVGLGSASAEDSGWRELRLEGIDGQWHALDAYIGRGQWVVVNIWGPRCPPCVEEMPELGSFHDTYVDGPAMVLGIAIDFPSFGYAKAKEVQAFMDDYLLDFPVLMADHTVYAQLVDGAQLQAVPTSLLYAPDGSLTVRHVGTLTQTILERYLQQRDANFQVVLR